MVLWPLQKMQGSIKKLLESLKISERKILVIFFGSAAIQVIILHLIDGKNLIDSVYATAATLTTIGFGDVSPSSPLARILYIPTMAVGVLMLPVAAVSIYEMHQRKVRGLSKSDQKEHVVILGNSNEIISSAVIEMGRSHKICLVSEIYEINPFPDAVHFIRGSPIEKKYLLQSNIAAARHVIIATGDDRSNILATALARELNPTADITVTIATEERSGTLRSLGANHVINTETFTGRLLASAVFEPSVVDLISDVTTSLVGHDLVEKDVPESLYGKTIGDAMFDMKIKDGVTLLAIYRNKETIANPPHDVVFEKGDKMVLLV